MIPKIKRITIEIKERKRTKEIRSTGTAQNVKEKDKLVEKIKDERIANPDVQCIDENHLQVVSK